MKKSSYFIVQFIWSLIFSSLICYFSFMHMTFDFYGNNNDPLFAIILLGGAAVYLVLTIIYIVLGFRTVEGRSAWMIIVSILICAVCGFLGSMAAIYIPEWINKM